MNIRKIVRRKLLWFRSPTRWVIEKKIFPALKNKKILFVGVADYIQDYPKMLNQNDLYTIDIDPSVKKFGATKHVVGDAVKINNYFNKDFFDVILHLGVLNYGLNTLGEANECLKNCFKVLKEGGLLVISSQEGPTNSGMKPLQIKDLDGFKLFTQVNAFGLPSEYALTKKNSFQTTFYFLKKNS